MFERILCPIDRSPNSLQAFDYALTLARWRGARLTLLEVADVAAVSTECRLALHTDLQGVLVAKRAWDVDAEVVLREGRVVEEVLRQAEASRSDLVVIGSHGLGETRRPMGSVAETVLRRATCPVLTVRRGVKQGYQCGAPFATVLCPTDFSAAATQAMVLARRLTEQADARLIILSVIEPATDHADGPGSAVAGGDAAPHAERAASEKTRRLLRLEGEPPQGDRVEAVVTFGEAAPEIIACGHDRSVDLVVMGVSGRGASEAAAVGSTSHFVIREGAWPVLTVRSRAEDRGST